MLQLKAISLFLLVSILPVHVLGQPAGLTATAISPRIIELSWTKGADTDSYKIYKDGNYMAWTKAGKGKYRVLWLEPGTQYSFTISAVDNGGNESAKTAAVQATTDEELYNDYYVGGWNINNEMDKITTACMDSLKKLDIVGITKSFGGSMVSGYSRLKNESSPYYLPAIQSGSPVPTDFDNNVIVKADTTRYPYTFRVEAVGWYLKNWAADVVDAGFVFWHNMTSNGYRYNEDWPVILNHYIAHFDSVQAAYPDVRLIYTCPGVVGESDLGRPNNLTSIAFNERFINRKRGLVPIYDMTSLLSIEANGDTSTFKLAYPDYPFAFRRGWEEWQYAEDRVVNIDSTSDGTVVPQIPASGLHPNAEGEKRMAKGMTLLLAKMYCPDCFPQGGTTDIKKVKPGLRGQKIEDTGQPAGMVWYTLSGKRIVNPANLTTGVYLKVSGPGPAITPKLLIR